jgi:hypothetical protein
MKEPYRESTKAVVQTAQEQATDATTPATLMDDPRIQQMALYIQQGLDTMEAAILAKFSEEEVQHMQKADNEFAKFVRLQRIKFKQSHLKTISAKSDAKTSQWMLEKTFPEDFGKQGSGNPDGQSDGTVITAIIRSIQRKDAEPVKVPFTVTDPQEASRYNETKRIKESIESSDAGGKKIL